MLDDRETAKERVEVWRMLRLLVEEAKRQGCLEEACRFPGVFAAFALLDPMIGEAVGRGRVSLDDLMVWLVMLLCQA